MNDPIYGNALSNMRSAAICLDRGPIAAGDVPALVEQLVRIAERVAHSSPIGGAPDVLRTLRHWHSREHHAAQSAVDIAAKGGR